MPTIRRDKLGAINCHFLSPSQEGISSRREAVLLVCFSTFRVIWASRALTIDYDFGGGPDGAGLVLADADVFVLVVALCSSHHEDAAGFQAEGPRRRQVAVASQPTNLGLWAAINDAAEADVLARHHRRCLRRLDQERLDWKICHTSLKYPSWNAACH